MKVWFHESDDGHGIYFTSNPTLQDLEKAIEVPDNIVERWSLIDQLGKSKQDEMQEWRYGP